MAGIRDGMTGKAAFMPTESKRLVRGEQMGEHATDYSFDTPMFEDVLIPKYHNLKCAK